jgi:hypothetical protein
MYKTKKSLLIKSYFFSVNYIYRYFIVFSLTGTIRFIVDFVGFEEVVVVLEQLKGIKSNSTI